MKNILFLLLVVPAAAFSQKITSDIRPDTHERWLATDDVNVNLKLVQAHPIVAHFRTQGAAIFMYLWDSNQLGANDYAYFVTDQDTVVAHSTGVQPGANFTQNIYHEYSISKQDLTILSSHPVHQVVVSHYYGWVRASVPEKDQNKLSVYCAALLKAMQE